MKVVSLSLAWLPWVAPARARRSAQATAPSVQGGTAVIRVSSELGVLDVLVENKKTGATNGSLGAAFCKLRVTLAKDTYRRHSELRKPEVTVRSRSGYYRRGP